MFPEGFLQQKGASYDGKPNAIVVEDTGIDRPVLDDEGKPVEDEKGDEKTVRVMHRYTVSDDLDDLKDLRDLSIRKNTFMFLSPVSYFGKSRNHLNARFLHAFMIDLDYVGDKELANLLHQMNRGVIPQANFLVSSGTGLHVVYLLKEPIPLMTRYVDGLQAIKRGLIDRVWNAHTSAADPEKRQYQGIYQGFRMVGTATKLNGEIGNPKLKQPYVVEAFSHDETPPATISYLLSFLPELKGMSGMDDLEAVGELSRLVRPRTPLDRAKELWPEWFEERVVQNAPRRGFLFGRAAYDNTLEAITNDASVSHRYWCIFRLAVMANKCGVSKEELKKDALSLVDRFDALTEDPSNPFTEDDVMSALKAYEDGGESGRARRYTEAFLERTSGVKVKKASKITKNPPDKRLPLADSLKVARLTRDLNQQRAGTNWWDNGNRDGAPTKAMQVWEVAYGNPDMTHSAIARKAGVSRPTVIKWLSVDDWRSRYEHAMKMKTDEAYREGFIRELEDEWLELEREQERRESDWYRPGGGFDRFVLETVIENPWKSLEEIAALCGLVDGESVKRVIDHNRELYGQIERELMI